MVVENECGCKTYQLDSSLQDVFAGLNCIVTVSKNNHLNWIRDFVEYHVNEHNLEALLFFDNESTDYTLSDLVNLFTNTKLKAFRVVSAPFPFGPVLKNRSSSPQYVQIASFNAARQFYLQSARAVLSLDIDELVAPSKSTVFDAAQASLFKMVRFKGYWRYTDGSHAENINHNDHYFRKEPEATCPHKYCYVPSSLVGSLPMEWHGISLNNSMLRKILHKCVNYPKGRFWHCSGLTTCWKGVRLATLDNLVMDEVMKQTMQRNFEKDTK